MFTEHVQSRAESKRHTTAKVVEAAQTLFRRVGYRETTVRQISAAAGVSVGAVMAVGGKESLLIMVYDDEILRRVDAPPEWEQGRAPEDQAVAIIAPFFDLFSSNEPLFREYARAIIRGVAQDHALGGRLALTQRALAETFAAAGLSETEANVGAGIVINVFLGQVLMWVAGHTQPDHAMTTIRRTVEWVIERKGEELP